MSYADNLEAQTSKDMDSGIEIPDIPLTEWGKGKLLDTISEHDKSFEVFCGWDGYDFTGVGLYSVGELVEVSDIEIEVARD